MKVDSRKYDHSVKMIFHFLTNVVLVFSLMGCASYPINDPLDKIDADVGYRLNNRTLGPKNSGDLFVVVGLSGGGTRATALDYGVLQYLDRV